MNYWDQQAQMKNMLLRLIVRNKLLEFRKLLL